jgi:hypothetical protein
MKKGNECSEGLSARKCGKVFPGVLGSGNRFPVLFFDEKNIEGVYWHSDRCFDFPFHIVPLLLVEIQPFLLQKNK